MRRSHPYLLLLGALLLLPRCGGDDDSPAVSPSGLKVVVVGLDGVHFGLLSPLLEQGRLPNLRAFLEKASLGVMASPIHEGFTSPALWTSIVTGLEPYEHGIADFVLPDPTTCEDVAAASGHRLAPALWNMLDAEGLPSAVVGLWATWPAETLAHGAVVSDHVTYSRMRLSKEFETADGATVTYDYDTATRNVFPSSLGGEVAKLVRLPEQVTAEDLRRFVPDLTDDEVTKVLTGEFGPSIQKQANGLLELKVTLQSDRSYADIGQLLARERDPAFLLVYLEGVDVMEHHFWPFHDPAFPRPIDAAERARYADVLSRYVEETDRLIAPYLEMADDDTVVIVVSDHGYATVDDPGHPSGHWHDHNAIFCAAGGPVAAQRVLDPHATSIYDVTPTVLALLGLPVGDDMKGRVIEEILDPTFLAAHPVTRRATWGRRPLQPGEIAASEDDEGKRERLAQMGYLVGQGAAGTSGPIRADSWASTPVTFGRLAIDCDVERGRAAFTTHPAEEPRPGRGPLPRCAIYRDDSGIEHPVIVIQVEETRGKTRVGFRFLDGTIQGTTGERVEALPEGPDERFWSG